MKLFKEGELIEFMFARINWKSQRGQVPTSHFNRATSALGIYSNKLVTKQYNIHTSQHRETHSSGNFNHLITIFKFFPKIITVLKFSFPVSGDLFFMRIVKITPLKSA